MKHLLLIRHAKSSWDETTARDFDRPLNERGLKEAPAMALRLLNKNISIDAFISSPAKRALTTAELFAKTYGLKEKNIIQIPELYNVRTETFFQVIPSLNNDFKTVALFSHNPGVTYFVNELTATKIDHMPTCGVFAINIKTDKWKNFEFAEKEFWFFDYPKSGL